MTQLPDNFDRGDETSAERKVLHLHRYKNWVDIYRQHEQELRAVQQRMAELGSSMSYALLEAREEFEMLHAMGLTTEEVEKAASLPQPPVDMSQMFTRMTGSKA